MIDIILVLRVVICTTHISRCLALSNPQDSQIYSSSTTLHQKRRRLHIPTKQHDPCCPHNNASYLNKPKAHSWSGGHFFISQDFDFPFNNGSILTTTQAIKNAMSSAHRSQVRSTLQHGIESHLYLTHHGRIGTRPATNAYIDEQIYRDRGHLQHGPAKKHHSHGRYRTEYFAYFSTFTSDQDHWTARTSSPSINRLPTTVTCIKNSLPPWTQAEHCAQPALH